MGKLGASLKGFQEPEPEQIDLEEVTGKPETPKLSELVIRAEAKRAATKKAAAPEPTGAKRSDPAFQQLKVYVRRATKTKASRKWEDEGRGDMSDLIETLLTEYLSS